MCVACTQKPLTDAEVDVALANANDAIATSCLTTQQAAHLDITIDVDGRGEPRYVRAASDETLAPKVTTCIQEKLMQLRFREGGTNGSRTRRITYGRALPIP